MDSLITAGARALASVDALGALNCIALRDDPPASALRAIAMAQLGDVARARLLLRRAAAFGPREEIARARGVTVRRVDPQSGEVPKLIEMPQGVGRIGPQIQWRRPFFCGGGTGGIVRGRKPKRQPKAVLAE
jgi:hypothetical protein